jgi:RNA polymerase-binding transcription factor DksA
MIDTAVYKTKLEEELSSLTGELKELGIHNPQVKEDWIATPQDVDVAEADENVGADRAEDWLERTATLGALETRYNNITRALSKITDGTYGTCEICGAEIEADRLEANPGARTCKTHINDEQDLPA